MKRLLYLLAIVLLAISCEKSQNQNSETAVTLTSVTRSSASLISDETLNLQATFTGEGYTLSISMKSNGLALPTGTFDADSYVENGCKVHVNDGYANRVISSGSIAISRSGDNYTIKADLDSKTHSYKFNFNGTIEFKLNLEVSENIIFAAENKNPGANSSYIVSVISPENEALVSIELINKPGLSLLELVGDYSLRSNSTSEGSAVAGAAFWGNGSGSWYIDNEKTRQYVSAGQISLTKTSNGAGGYYFTLIGSGLSTVDLSDKKGTGAITQENLNEAAFDGYAIRNMTVSSTAMNRTMKYSIYLPSGYEEGTEYPILYLLHGYGDENNAWLDKGLLINNTFIHETNGGTPMIVVCPDGLAEFYVNKFETYMHNELMPHIESTYKFNGKRAVAGLSMGGYGTLYHGLKYPDLFSYAYACSAAIDMGDKYPSLYDLARKANPDQLPGITLEMGTEDYTTGNGFNFHNTLTAEGIQHEYITRSGTHDWKFWQECLPKVLKKCGESFE